MKPSQLADKTGLSRGYISDLLHGRRGERIGADTAIKLTKALKVSPLFFSPTFANAKNASSDSRKTAREIASAGAQ